jgi:hypothetical protein
MRDSSDRAEPGFLRDVEASLAVWPRQPLLPAIGLSIVAAEALLTAAGNWVLLPSICVAFVHAGWCGTERIRYLRAFRGETFQMADARGYIPAFMGRFVVLGLLAAVIILPVVMVLSAATPGHAHLLSGAGLWIFAVVALLVDFALTFVTPALAYSTRRVREALRIGLRMIREQWPRSSAYVIVAPLAVQLMYRVVRPTQVRAALAVPAALVAGLIGVAFKGAIARFYLRHHDIGDDGSAFMPRAPVNDVLEPPPQTRTGPAG